MEWKTALKKHLKEKASFAYSPILEAVPFSETQAKNLATIIDSGINPWYIQPWKAEEVPYLLTNLSKVVKYVNNIYVLKKYGDLLKIPSPRFSYLWENALKISEALNKSPLDALTLANTWKYSKNDLHKTYKIMSNYIEDYKLFNWLNEHGHRINITLTLQKLAIFGTNHLFNEFLLYNLLPNDIEYLCSFMNKEFPHLSKEERTSLALSNFSLKLSKGHYTDIWNTLSDIAITFGLDEKKLKQTLLSKAAMEESYLKFPYYYSKDALNEIYQKAELLHQKGVLKEVVYSGGFFYIRLDILKGLISTIWKDPLIKNKEESLIEHIKYGIGPWMDLPTRIVGDLLEEKFKKHKNESLRLFIISSNRTTNQDTQLRP